MTQPAITGFVLFPYMTSSGYGVVVGATETYRPKSGRMEQLLRVRPINPGTGLPVVCPDTQRCGPTSTCVICAQSFWPDQIRPFTPVELEVFQAEGMIQGSA